MLSGGWWEDPQLHNGSFCTYYVLGPGPGFQEVAKFSNSSNVLHSLSLSTARATFSSNPWKTPKMQAGLISCINRWVIDVLKVSECSRL